jgi:hypothetical protein
MPILTGLAIGAAMGGGIAALQGGDVLKGALLGAAGGGLGGAFMPAVAGAGAGVAGGAGGASGAAGALGGASGAGAGASLYSTGLGAGLGGSSIPTVAQLGTSAATGSTLGAGIGGTTIPTVAQLGTSAATGAGGAGASGLTALMSQFKYPLMGGVAGGLMSETPEQATMPEQEGEIRPYEYSEELNPNFGMPGQPYYSSQTFTPKTPVPYEDFTGFKQGGIAYLAEGGEPKYTTPVRTVNPDVAAYNTKIADQARYEYVDSPQLGAFQSAIPNAGAYNPEAGAALQALRAEQAVAPSAQANKFGYRYDPVTGGVVIDKSNMPAPEPESFGGFDSFSNNYFEPNGNFNGGNNNNANGGAIKEYAQGGISSLGSYSDGGSLLKGPGDGVSDDIPATISGKQPARLADGEFVVPARIVSELGNGSTDAGARRLYEMMNRVQSNRSKTVGKDKIAVDSKARRMLPA